MSHSAVVIRALVFVAVALVAAGCSATAHHAPQAARTVTTKGVIIQLAATAGTATAVSKRVSRRQGNRWVQQEQQQVQQQVQQQPQCAAPPARDQVAQLKDLAELKSSGILTDAEFDAQRAKILAC